MKIFNESEQAPAQPIADSWCATLTVKCNELELIASWASQVREDACRDHCRKAIAALRKSIEFRQDVLRATSDFNQQGRFERWIVETEESMTLQKHKSAKN